MSQQPLRVLLADDEISLREPLAKHLRQAHSYEVDTAADGQEVLNLLEQRQGQYEVALIDDLLVPEPGCQPEPLGVSLINAIRAHYPGVEVIIFTGWGMHSGLEVLRAGAYRYLAKPFNLEELGMLIQTAAEHSRLKSVAREKQILEQLMKTSTALLSEQSLPEVLDTILHGVQAIGFERVGLYLLSEDRQMMVGQAQVGMPTEFVGHIRPVTTDPHMQILITNPHPHVFERENGRPLLYEQELGREGVTQWACVPLVLHEEVVGKLTMDNKFSQRPILIAELKPVDLFASQAAAAIENTRLRNNEREAIQKAEQRARNLKAVQEVATAISSLMELDKILESTCRAAVELFEVNHSGLVLFEEPDYTRGWVAAEYPNLGAHGMEIPVLGVPAEEDLIRSQKPFILSDVSKQEPSLGPIQNIFRRFNICSILIVPVVNKGRVLGSFSLEGIDHSHTFTDEEIEQCQIFAAQVAVAVENAQLYKNVAEERDRSEWMAEQLLALYQITQEIQTELNLPNLLNLISRLAAKLLEADAGGILLLDNEKQHLTFKGAYGLSQKAVEDTCDKVGSSIAGRVVQLGESIIANDIPNNPQFYNPAADDEGWLAILSTPLRVGGKIIGTLDVHSRSELYAFNEDDLQTLSLMANQAAIAIENVRLFQQTSHRALALEALHRTSLDITSHRQIPELVNSILERAVELLQAKGGALYLLDETGNQAKVAAVSNLPEHFVGVSLELKGGVIGHIINDRNPLFVSDYRNWPYRLRQYDEYGFTAVAGAPITWQDKTWGVLAVHDTIEGKTFNQEDLDLLSHFGNLAAVALENAELVSKDTDKLNRLAKLSQASSEMMGSLGKMPLDERLNLITIHAAEILEAEACGIFLVKQSGFLSLEASYGHRDGGFLKGRELAIRSGPKTGLTGHIAYEGKLFNAHGENLNNHFAVKGESDHAASRKCHSILVIPLKKKGKDQEELVGLLRVDNKKDRDGQGRSTISFTQEDEWIISLLADVVVVAIEGAELFQAIKHARESLRSFYEASNALVSSRDPEQVLQDIVEQTRIVANAVSVSVFLIDEIGQRRTLMAAGTHKKFDANVIRPNGISMQVVNTGKTEVIEDTNKQRNWVNPIVFQHHISAALCLPLSLQGKRIGVMWIHYNQPRHFSTSDIEAIQLYVNQAAITYDSARRIKELKYLHRAAEALAGAAGLQEVLEQIVHSAQDVLQADSTVIWSYDEVQKRFMVDRSVSTGIPAEWWPKFQKSGPRRGGTAYTVMEEGWVGVIDIDDVERYGFLGGPTSKLLRQLGTRSFQGIALIVGEEKLGILYVNYNHPRSFSDKERDIAQTFANHAALALKRAKLLDQVRRAQDAARVVAKVTALEELQGTLDSIVRGTRDVLVCDAVTLYTYDQDQKRFGFPPAMVGVKYPEKVLELGKVAEGSVIRNVLALNDLYVTEDARTNLLLHGPFVEREGIVSAVGIPLIVRGRQGGVMFVNYRRVHHFTEDELTNIELFAHQAAVAIRNAQLYEQVQKWARTLQALYEAGQAVIGSLNLEEILFAIAEQAWTLTSASRCSHLARMDRNKLTFIAAYPPEQLSGLQQRVGIIDLEQSNRIGVTGRTARTGQSQLVVDASQDPDYIEFDSDTHSELAVPIKIEEQVIGVINVEHVEYKAFDEADQRALEALAAQAAVAIHNAQQYEELKRTKGLVGTRTALAWMGMATSTWRHAIDKHALTIREQVQLLSRNLDQTDLPKQYPQLSDRLSTIERLASKILEKSLTPPLTAEEGVEAVTINDLIGERARQLWQNEPYKIAMLRIDLQLPGTATVKVSPEWLRRAFDILVDNAIDAVSSREIRAVVIGTRMANEGVDIFISDTGPGLPQEIQEKIGLEVIEKPEDAKGLGMGLLMAQTIIQTYSGTLRVGSTSPAGTSMVIWLPLENRGV